MFSNELPGCQVSILAFSATPGTLETSHAELIVLGIIQSHGDLVAYHRLADDEKTGIHAAIADFPNSLSALNAATALNGRVVQVGAPRHEHERVRSSN